MSDSIGVVTSERTGRSTEEDPALTLELLQAIDRDNAASQRSLSDQLGIALGSVNWHLKRCIRKGLIKVQQAPLRRYAYYLTPEGFEKKSRLTLEYIQTSMGLFRKARAEFSDLFSALEAQGFSRALLVGAGELSEAAVLSAADSRVLLIGVVIFGHPEERRGERLAGIPISSTLADALRPPVSSADVALVLTDITAPAEVHTRLLAEMAALGIPQEILTVPTLLHLDRQTEPVGNQSAVEEG